MNLYSIFELLKKIQQPRILLLLTAPATPGLLKIGRKNTRKIIKGHIKQKLIKKKYGVYFTLTIPPQIYSK